MVGLASSGGFGGGVASAGPTATLNACDMLNGRLAFAMNDDARRIEIARFVWTADEAAKRYQG